MKYHSAFINLLIGSQIEKIIASLQTDGYEVCSAFEQKDDTRFSSLAWPKKDFHIQTAVIKLGQSSNEDCEVIATKLSRLLTSLGISHCGIIVAKEPLSFAITAPNISIGQRKTLRTSNASIKSTSETNSKNGSIMISNNHYSDITSWLKVIASNKKRSKVFYIENDDAFIADGKLLKCMPVEYAKYSAFDEFYVHVNVKEKEILYQAWNIENFDELRTSVIESGMLDWDKMEFIILTFLTANMSKLSYSVGTMNSLSSSTSSTSSTTTPYTHTPYNHTPYKPTTTSYFNEPDYKERESAKDKLAELLKQNKTSKAIDHVDHFVTKLCEDKKFYGLDLFISALPVDNMNVPMMFTVLKATRGADHLLKDRKTFFEKVKTRLSKTGKLSKAIAFLNELEPGKEYPGVTKYNNEPQAEKKDASTN